MEEFQSEFTRLTFQSSPMNLHKHESLTKVEVVVLFVHGLMGSGYDTWAGFPKFVFEEYLDPVCDVAVFDYCSGHRRWLRLRPSLRQISETLAERLVYLAKKYEHVYVVAHSMGGLVSLHAVKHYLEYHDTATKRLKRIAGVMLFGSPLDGSRYSPGALKILFREAGYLRVRAPHQRRIRRYFGNRVETRNISIYGQSDYQVALYAGTADYDQLVTNESATVGITEKQQRTFVEDHSSLVKPSSADADQVSWVREMVEDVTRNRGSIRYNLNESFDAARPRLPRRALSNDDESMLVTDSLHEVDGHEWWAIYKKVVAGASTRMVTVCDRSESRAQSRNSELLFCIGDSVHVIERRPSTVDMLASARNAYIENDVDVRIVAVGDEMAAAHDALIAVVDPGSLLRKKRAFFVDAVADGAGLYLQLQRYIAVLISHLEDRLRARLDISDDLRIRRAGTLNLAWLAAVLSPFEIAAHPNFGSSSGFRPEEDLAAVVLGRVPSWERFEKRIAPPEEEGPPVDEAVRLVYNAIYGRGFAARTIV